MGLHQYLIRLADHNLILGHRLSEWCGHGPFLEQDMAMTNLSLDLIGQARSMYALAAQLQGAGKSEDDLAFVRLEHEYQNLLITELPNGDFAHTVIRQFLFSSWQVLMYQNLFKLLENTEDPGLESFKGILEKAIKEIVYHVRWSGEWVIRLGDGTEESHQRAQKALNDIYKYTGEAFIMDDLDNEAIRSGYGVDTNNFKTEYLQNISKVMHEASLVLPENQVMLTGGKQGRHTEYMGYILAELQYMQRAYPNATW